jgi:hypothetical protein
VAPEKRSVRATGRGNQARRKIPGSGIPSTCCSTLSLMRAIDRWSKSFEWKESRKWQFSPSFLRPRPVTGNLGGTPLTSAF